MKEWITTREASEVETIGLTQHRIAELARLGKIVADKTGEGKWLVKVTFNNGIRKLVEPKPPAGSVAGCSQYSQYSLYSLYRRKLFELKNCCTLMLLPRSEHPVDN